MRCPALEIDLMLAIVEDTPGKQALLEGPAPLSEGEGVQEVFEMLLSFECR